MRSCLTRPSTSLLKNSRASLQALLEVRTALPRRDLRLLRMEKTRSEGVAETALRHRNGGRGPDGDGWPMGEVEGPEIGRRGSELHDHYLRT